MRDMFNKHNIFIKKMQQCSPCPLEFQSSQMQEQADETVAPTTADMEATAEGQMSSWSNQRQQHQ